MPTNDPNAYNVKGKPSSGLKKPVSPPKVVKPSKAASKKAKATTELEKRLKKRRDAAAR